jgi:hypothetical protein
MYFDMTNPKTPAHRESRLRLPRNPFPFRRCPAASRNVTNPFREIRRRFRKITDAAVFYENLLTIQNAPICKGWHLTRSMPVCAMNSGSTPFRQITTQAMTRNRRHRRPQHRSNQPT